MFLHPSIEKAIMQFRPIVGCASKLCYKGFAYPDEVTREAVVEDKATDEQEATVVSCTICAGTGLGPDMRDEATGRALLAYADVETDPAWAAVRVAQARAFIDLDRNEALGQILDELGNIEHHVDYMSTLGS